MRKLLAIFLTLCLLTSQAFGAFSYTNSHNVFESWSTSGETGNIWLGAHVTGDSSGAEGIIVEFLKGFTDITGVILLETSGSFTAGEDITVTGGGSFTLAGSMTSTETLNTIIATGSYSADSTEDIQEAVDTSETDIDIWNMYNLRAGWVIKVDNEIMAVKLLSTGTQTDTGTNTSEVINTTETVIDVQDATKVTAGRIIRVQTAAAAQQEVMYVVSTDTVSSPNTMTVIRTYSYNPPGTGIAHSTNSDIFHHNCVMTVDRPYMQTTAATHTSGTDIYRLSENIFKDIYDYDVAQGWGYGSTSGSKIVLDCNILLGIADQTELSQFLSKDENIEVKGNVLVSGNATYPTVFRSGMGVFDEDETIKNGSILNINTDIDADFTGLGLTSVRYGVAELFGTNTTSPAFYDEGYIQRCNLTPDESNEGTTLNAYDWGFGDYGSGTSYAKDILCSGNGVNPARALIDWEDITVGDSFYGAYFISSGGADINIRGLRLLNVGTDAFDFVDSGCKNFIDSEVDITGISGFWGRSRHNILYSLNLLVQDKQDNPIESATVRYIDQYGVGCFRTVSSATLAEDVNTTETGIDVSDGAQFAIGDVILLDAEKCLVTNISTNTLTVTRTYGTSVNGSHTSGDIIYTMEKTTTTDSNGQIAEQYMIVSAVPIGGAGAGTISYYTPFTLTIYKDGYETYKESLTPTEAIDYRRDLKHSVSAGRDAMGDEFR